MAVQQNYPIRNQSLSNRDRLPKLPGVYLFRDQKGMVIYVGKALNLSNRVSSYFLTTTDEKPLQLRKVAVSISLILTDSEFNALLLESSLIKKHRPKYNIIHKDDKHYLYIKITSGDEFPRVFTSRKEDDSKSTYFGPFPRSQSVHETLQIVRKIIPFCGQKRIGKKPCFYAHLHLCNPCPSFIVQQPKEKREILKRTYRSAIFHLIALLSGRHKKVATVLRREMERLSWAEKFEEAGLILNKLRYLESITTTHHRIGSYLENPDFLVEEQMREVVSLQEKLQPYFPDLKEIVRLECFDISNLFGHDAVGSMVVFINGTQEKREYKRFRIKTIKGANDPAMMKEVLMRRFAHLNDWGMPDLIVVDGGKTQLARARQAIGEMNLTIPVVGLAKRLEQIVIAQKNGFILLTIPHSTPGLNLLRRLRDEAHRFAITYHRKLRSFSFTSGVRKKYSSQYFKK